MFSILGLIVALVMVVLVAVFITAVKNDSINLENLPVVKGIVEAVEEKIVPFMNELTDNDTANIALSLVAVFIITYAWWPAAIITLLVVTLLNK
jgi:hypothetical protein